MTKVRWEFTADSFDQIVAAITEHGGPPYFEEILSAGDLAAMARIAEPMLAYGIRWGKYLNDEDLPPQ